MKRRFFLFAAPAIVAAPSLMRVSTACAWSRFLDAHEPRETLHELLARRIKAAEEAMLVDLERVYWDTPLGNSDPRFGLASLLTVDGPVAGGIDRRGYEWKNHSVTIYGRS